MTRRLILLTSIAALLLGTVYVGLRVREGPSRSGRAPAEVKPDDLLPAPGIVEVLSPDSIPSIDEPTFVAPKGPAGGWRTGSPSCPWSSKARPAPIPHRS